ncbi:MAG: hypothetical protein FJ146_00030 [Deltaproteobacteria bacterium]|nr:hypothetical protein [Deltaproteobacteria bacterium]
MSASLEHADVANGSFGFEPQQARMLIGGILKIALRGSEPNQAQVDKLPAYFLKKVATHQVSLISFPSLLRLKTVA